MNKIIDIIPILRSPYSFGFNGKEQDDEIYGDANAYDFGARVYDARICKYMAIDPLSSVYSYWSPYSFPMNNPIRFIDIYGLGPGDPYKTEAEAAKDFGYCYVDNSIQNKVEYFTIICKGQDSNGETFYYYTVPIFGTASLSGIPNGYTMPTDIVAYAHTHGNYTDQTTNVFSDLPQEIKDEVISDMQSDEPIGLFQEFSCDILNADINCRNLYMIGTNGVLQLYNPDIPATSSVAFDLPGDPADPQLPEQNLDYNDPSLPKDEPSESLFLYRDKSVNIRILDIEDDLPPEIDMSDD